MNTLFDALLSRPFQEIALRGLLFVLFSVHLLFVLFAVGTAIFSMYSFIRYHWSGAGADFAWGRQVFETFLAHKSLAVVIGVGALLLMQVGFTVPFFTAINLFAPFWLLIIVALIISFLSLDMVERNWETRPALRLVFGVIGLVFLLAVPGVFVAVLIATEHPELWLSIMQSGYKLTGTIAQHWLLRYGHVLGAAIIFAGLLHYLFSKQDQVHKKASLLRWIRAGILYQVVVGIILYLSLPDRPDTITNLSLATGILFAAFLLFLTFRPQRISFASAAPVGLLILLPMLLGRQMIQDRGILTVNAAVSENAKAYQAVIAPNTEAGLAKYRADFGLVYDNGDTIYQNSCSFCHGKQALGDGVEAASLAIPPKPIAYSRFNQAYLHARLTKGIPGSAMPYFTPFTLDKLDDLMTYLNNNYKILGQAQPPTLQIPDTAIQEAKSTFETVCSTCHGTDGKGQTSVSAGFAPAPPDFTQYSMEAQAMFGIISNGYPGTMMAAHSDLPDAVRWGLVTYVQEFYHSTKAE